MSPHAVSTHSEHYGGGGHLSSCKCQSSLKLVRPLLWRTGEKLSWQTRTLKDFHRREDSMAMPVCQVLIWNFPNVLHLPPSVCSCGGLRAAKCSLNNAESLEYRRRWRSAQCIIATCFRATASAVPDWESSGPRTQHDRWKRSWFGQNNPYWHLLLTH